MGKNQTKQKKRRKNIMKRMKKTVAACLTALLLMAGCSAQEEPAEQPEAAPDTQRIAETESPETASPRDITA